MTRRDFITLLGSAAVSLPLGARAQRAKLVRRIGFLLGLSESDPDGRVRIAAFRQGLEVLGWAEARNIRIGPLCSATTGMPASRPLRQSLPGEGRAGGFIIAW
jgi:hypothetical protein